MPRPSIAIRRPELELLLCCSRPHIDNDAAEQITFLLQEEHDWEYLLAAAVRHGVLVRLYGRLKKFGSAIVPPSFTTRLEESCHASALQNVLASRELLKLLNLFSDHEIDAIPFKGPLLAWSLYGNVALRPFTDLDILVREHDVPTVTRLLTTSGYRLSTTLNRSREMASRHSYTYVSGDGRTCVDLHWRITSAHIPFSPDLESIWLRAQPITFEGQSVLNLSPADVIWMLCVHGSKHYWSRIAWICDVAEFLRVHPDLDWRGILEQANSRSDERLLLLGPLLAEELLGAALPPELSRSVHSDHRLRVRAEKIRGRLLTGMSAPRGQSLERYAFLLSLIRHVPAQMRLLQHAFRWAITPNDKDRIWLPLPVSLLFIHYPVRLLRLARDLAKNLVTRRRAKAQSVLAEKVGSS